MAVALETVVKQLADSGIIAQGQLENFVPPKAQPKDADELIAQLVKENHLTKFQAAQVAAGKSKSLILGEYTILDKIGAGGMGQVFKALHRRMDRLVAIKMLPPAMMKDAAAIARFEREVRAAAKLRHPNIVAADDAGQANGVHFLVMEYVEGQDLSALVKKNGPFPVDKAANYLLQAARGLEFAHGEGVIHRDIKPANLLVDKKGTVKILDMGLARIEGAGNVAAQAELTGTGAVMGTVDYMAPEQALSTKHADARADVYSLGCTLHYLVTGRPPYSGETLMARLLAHREDPIPSLGEAGGNVSPELEAIFQKLLAKRIDERYQTMTELIVDLERITGAGSSISSNTVGAPQVSNSFDSGLVTFLKDLPQQTTKKSVAAKPDPHLAAGLVPASSAAAANVARGQAPRLNKKFVGIVSGGIVVCAVLVVGLIIALKNRSDEPVEAIQANNPGANTPGSPADVALPTTWTPGPERDPKALGLVPRPAVLPGLRSWQLETVRPRLTIAAAAWNKQGTHFACLDRGSNVTSIRIYEYVADRLQLRHILPAVNQYGDWLSWSPDGKRLVAGQNDRLVVWQLEGRTARVAAERKLLDNFFAQWSPIGPWIAISTSDNVQLWNPDTHESGAKLELPKTTYLRRVAWRPDGARLAVENGKQAIRIWDPASGNDPNVLSIETPLISNRAAFVWSPDGALLAVYRTATAGEKNSQVEIWDTDQGKKTATLQGTPSGTTYDLFFVDGGRSIALSSNGLPAWNVADGKPLGEKFKGVIIAPGMAVPGPQPHLVTAAEGRNNVPFKAQIGNVQAGTAATVMEGLPEAESIAWNPNGRTIAIGALDKTLRFLSATDGAPRTLIRNLVHPMGAIAWSADGRRLACAVGQIAYVYDRSTTGKLQVWDLPAGNKLNEFTVSQNQVDALSWSRDGKYLAATGSEAEPVRIYLDGDNKVFRSLPKPGSGKGIATVAWSPDNRHLAVGLIPGGVTVFEALTGKVQAVVSETVNMSVHHERLAFSPAGDRFVFSSVGPVVGRVLTLDGKTVYEIPNAGRAVVSWSPDDRWIVASNENLAFYAAASGQAAGRVLLPQTYAGATFQSWSPDGKFLAYAQQAFTTGVVDVQRREIVWSAILLPGGETAVINTAGQLLTAPPSAESELCYVCETTPDVFELLKPSEFKFRPASGPERSGYIAGPSGTGSPPAAPPVAWPAPPDKPSSMFERPPANVPAIPAADVVYLDDLPEIEWKGHGRLGKQGLDWSSNAISWRGRSYLHAMMTHPHYVAGAKPTPASVAYAINAQYETLAATIGLADSSKGSISPLTFRVLGNGRELWKSPPIQKPTDEATFSVSVAGVRELRLEVEAEAAITGAHAVWIEPRLTRLAPTPPASAAPSKLFMHDPAFPQWVKDVQAMAAEQQIEAVRKKLVELNPGFDGTFTGINGSGAPRIENGTVTQLMFYSDDVTDISPVRALFGLKSLRCPGSIGKKGRLSDLSQLQGLSLTSLFCNDTQVTDLSPLKGMLLTNLACNGTQVSTLSPLHGMPLTHLSCDSTRVTDLSSLQGMLLESLTCNNTQISDLSPLTGMPLTNLKCHNTQVSDLSPLQNCKGLLFLSVNGTKATPAAIAALQKFVPSCKIVGDDPAKATVPQPAASATK